MVQTVIAPSSNFHREKIAPAHSWVTLLCFFLSRVHDEFFILAATGAAAFDIYFYRFIESLALVNPIGDWFNIYFNNVHWIVKTEIQEVQLRYNN